MKELKYRIISKMSRTQDAGKTIMSSSHNSHLFLDQAKGVKLKEDDAKIQFPSVRRRGLWRRQN